MKLFFAILISLSAQHALATPYLLTSSTPPSPIYPSLSYYIDPGEMVLPEELPNLASAFDPLPKPDAQAIHLSYVAGNLWLRLEVQNQTQKSQWLFGAKKRELEVFEVYKMTDSSIKVIEPPEKPLFEPTIPHVYLPIEPGENATFYIKVKSRFLINFPLGFFPTSEFYEFSYITNAILFLFFGAALTLFLYHIFLFLNTKDALSLSYAFFVASMGVTILNHVGWHRKMDIFILTPLAQHSGLALNLLPIVLGIDYSRRFVKTALSHDLIDGVGSFLSFFSILLIGVLVFTREMHAFSGAVYDASVFMAISFILTASIMAVRAKVVGSGLFLLGWGILCVMTMIWQAANHGLLPTNYFTLQAPLLGSFTEMIICSYAIALRYQSLQTIQIEHSFKKKEAESLRNLLRVICHDLANPIMVMDNAIPDTDPSPRFVRLRRATNHIKLLIEQVKRMEQVHSGDYKVELEWTPLVQIFDELKFLLGRRAKSKGISLQFQMDDKVKNAMVWAEPITLIHDVFANFLSNAIKYSHQNSAILISYQEEGSTALITIKDHGIGMEPELLETLLKEGKNKSQPGTADEKGSGFGISLAQFFVNQYEGSLTITSEKETLGHDRHGTEVKVFLKRRSLSADPAFGQKRA